MPFWVYILRCSDGSYYTGQTDNLEKRFAEHTSGCIPTCYTYQRRPVELVFSQEFATREEALVSERQIKGWSRKKKEAMMRGDWSEVSRLARSSPVRAEPSVRAKSVEANSPSVRAEPVEADSYTVRAEPVEANSPPVRAEPVEAQSSSGEAPPFDKLRADGR